MIEKLLDAWRKLDNLVAKAEQLFLVLAVLTMVGAIFGQSVLRFGWDEGLLGANELATHLMVWVGFLSASLATRERKHIVIDIVPRLLGTGTTSSILSILTGLVSAALLIFLAYISVLYYQNALIQLRTTPALSIPVKYVVLGMPVALSLMSLRFIQLSIEELAIVLGRYPEEKRKQAPSLELVTDGEGA